MTEMLRDGLLGRRFQFDMRSVGLWRPELSLPAYAGRLPSDGLAPIYNLFDRTGGGRRYSQRVSRARCRDYRGGRLSYDEHDGTDLVCPIGLPLCAPAPGEVVMIRDRWLRGGLTVAIDHGGGLLTQLSHCSRALAELGQPVGRGEPVALSGAAGVDLVTFFPWIPPHVHFLVMRDGRPIDPFRRPGEDQGAGSWRDAGDPRPAERPEAAAPEPWAPSPIDRRALELVATGCTDAVINREIDQVAGPAALAALLEDALVHDTWAWPAELRCTRLRAVDGSAPAPRLTLPLPAAQYRGARFADAPWTRPEPATGS